MILNYDQFEAPSQIKADAIPIQIRTYLRAAGKHQDNIHRIRSANVRETILKFFSSSCTKTFCGNRFV